MKKFEYKEPEFMIVQANTEDILTASGPMLNMVSGDWDTGKTGKNGAVGFGFGI